MADYNTAFGPAASGRGIKKCNKQDTSRLRYIGDITKEVNLIEMKQRKGHMRTIRRWKLLWDGLRLVRIQSNQLNQLNQH
jgi:hypothetical protein